MELENQFKYLVGGYFGVSLMDEYPLKEYILEDIKEYIKDFIQINPIANFNYEEEANKVKDTVTDKVKLQDSLLVLNKIQGPIDLVLLIKKKLKQYK
jgi:chromosome condensin MukBEF complex kleisin-like MukF subunit